MSFREIYDNLIYVFGEKEMSLSGINGSLLCSDCTHCIVNYCRVLKAMLKVKRAGGCRNYTEREEMSVEKAYMLLQKKWVKLYDVEVGDIVEVLRVPNCGELGSGVRSPSGKGHCVRGSYNIKEIRHNCISLANGSTACLFPFFCLEFVKKADPTIEITCRVNGKVSTLKDISEETLLNIRRNS